LEEVGHWKHVFEVPSSLLILYFLSTMRWIAFYPHAWHCHVFCPSAWGQVTTHGLNLLKLWAKIYSFCFCFCRHFVMVMRKITNIVLFHIPHGFNKIILWKECKKKEEKKLGIQHISYYLSFCISNLISKSMYLGHKFFGKELLNPVFEHEFIVKKKN
jgi:hypothetical protein